MKKILLTLAIISFTFTITTANATKLLINAKNAKTITLKQVQVALKHGVNIKNAVDKHYNTSLMYASKYSHNPKIIELLLDHGANVNASDLDDYTALMWAIEYNPNFKIISLLVNHGANINAHTDIVFRISDLKDNQMLVNDDNGVTPFMLAVKYNNSIKILKFLLKHGAKINRKRNRFLEDRHTALFLACEYTTNFKTIEFLLNHGAKINGRDELGRSISPLIYVIKNDKYSKESNKFKVIELLLNHGANVHIKDKDGMTALLYACDYHNSMDNTKIIDLLLKHGANIHAINKYDYTALMLTGHNDPSMYNTMKFLIQKGINVHAKNMSGETALFSVSSYLIINGLPTHSPKEDEPRKEFGLLIKAGIDPNIKNHRGNTIYTLAGDSGLKALVEKYQKDTPIKSTIKHTQKIDNTKPILYINNYFFLSDNLILKLLQNGGTPTKDLLKYVDRKSTNPKLIEFLNPYPRY